MHRSCPAWTFFLLATASIAVSCDPGVTPTGMDPTAFSEAEEPSSAEGAPSDAPLLPPGVANLPIEQLLRTKFVPFPGAGQVGVCHTQVAVPIRPVPFRVHRLPVDLPQEAWVEAAGRTVLLEYQRLGENGFVMRLARCRIPDSQAAADALFERFSLAPDRAGDTPATRLNLVEVRRWGADLGPWGPTRDITRATVPRPLGPHRQPRCPRRAARPGWFPDSQMLKGLLGRESSWPGNRASTSGTGTPPRSRVVPTRTM